MTGGSTLCRPCSPAPLCSVHPWRSPNCKTGCGLRLAGSSLTAGPWRHLGQFFWFQWSLLISNKLKLIDGCSFALHAHSPPACFARHTVLHISLTFALERPLTENEEEEEGDMTGPPSSCVPRLSPTLTAGGQQEMIDSGTAA